MKIVDLTKLNWTTTHNGGASYGCYYKATNIENGIKYYYKCSNFYSNTNKFGDESINEVIISRLLDILGFNCAKYTLVLANIKIKGKIYTTYVCKSKNYFTSYESRSTLENIHETLGLDSVDETINFLGIGQQIKEMIIADFITLQRDRHGGNIEILYKDGKPTMAPLFDNGLGLFAPYPSYTGDSIKNFNVLEDKPVNNYVGKRSLLCNLDYIDKPIVVNKLKKSDKKHIMYGLSSVLPDEYIEMIWKLITYRYMFLKQRGLIHEKNV